MRLSSWRLLQHLCPFLLALRYRRTPAFRSPHRLQIALVSLSWGVVIFFPSLAGAQGYGLGVLTPYERGTVTIIDRPLESSEDFDLIFALNIANTNNPAGTLTFDLGGASHEGFTETGIGFILPNFQCTPNENTLTCTWGAIVTQTPFTFVFGLRLEAPAVTEETLLPITATVAPFDPASGLLAMQDIQLTVEPGAIPPTDLATTINGPAEVGTNALFTYDVTIENNGPNASGTFTMSTLVDTNWEVIGGSLGTCVPVTTQNLQCEGVGSLGVGESITITVTARAGPAEQNSIINARWINDALEDPTAGNNIAFHQIVVVESTEEADLSLACAIEEADKQGEEIPVGVPATVACTLVNNGGDDANEITVFIELGGVSVEETIASSNTPGVTCEDATCTHPTLAAGNSIEVDFTFTPTEEGDLTATITSTTSSNETNPADNQIALALSVFTLGIADLSLTITATPSVHTHYREDVPFTIVVTNEGPDDATNVGVIIPLDSFPYLDVDCEVLISTGGMFGALYWEIDSLQSGESATCVYRGENYEGGYVHLDSYQRSQQAEIYSSDQPDPDSTPFNNDPAEDDFAEAVVTFGIYSSIHETANVIEGTTSSTSGGVLNVSDQELDYLLTLLGDGTNVEVVEVIPPPESDLFCEPPDSDGRVSCEGTLTPGEEAVIEIILKALIEGTGEVCAEANGFPPVCAAVEVEAPMPLPDLYVQIQPRTLLGGHGDPFVTPGELYIAAVTVGNIGDAASENSVLTLHLPQGTDVADWPSSCIRDTLSSDVIFDCFVGPLPVAAQRFYDFYLLAPDTIDDDQLISHRATIMPLEPETDKNILNHEAEAQTLVTTRTVSVSRRTPKLGHIGQDIALTWEPFNFSDELVESIQLALEADADFMVVGDLGGTGVETDFSGSTITQTLAEIPGNTSVQLGVLGLFTTAGAHEMTATVTVLGVEIYTETFVIEVQDGEPTCVVSKTLVSEDATPPVGDLTQFRLAVTSSEAIENVILTDELPGSTRIPRTNNGSVRFAPPNDCQYTVLELGIFGNSITGLECQFPLQAGETREFFFFIESVRSGKITNMAEACGTSDAVTIEPQAIQIEFLRTTRDPLELIDREVQVGEPFNIEALIANLGPSDVATDVRAFLEMESDLDIAFQSSLRCDISTKAAFCSLGTLEPGEDTQVSVIARAMREAEVGISGLTFSEDGRDDTDFLRVKILSREARFGIANARFGEGGNKQTEALDIYIDGTLLVDDLAAGSATPFLSHLFTRTRPRLDIVAADASDNSTPLASLTPDFVGPSGDTLAFSEQTLLLLAETPGDTLGLILKYGALPSGTDATKADVFFVHASPDAPPFIAQLRSVHDASEPLAFGETSAYQTVEPGVYLVDITNAETSLLVDTFRLDLANSAGEAVALVLTGRIADDSFTLDAFDATGGDVPSPVEQVLSTLTFTLYGNYPNPFNPTTTLRYDLPEPAQVRVDVFDVLGRRVLALPSQQKLAGASQTQTLDASSLASGLYLYRITADAPTQSYQQYGRMLLLK